VLRKDKVTEYSSALMHHAYIVYRHRHSYIVPSLGLKTVSTEQ